MQHVIQATLQTLCVLILVALLCRTSHSLTVHLVCHTHDDVGWLKTVDQYYLGANNSIQHAGVQYILDSVMASLLQNPDRRFVYVEQAYFQRWWRQQTAAMQTAVKRLVSAGQLEFINGGWAMHDEAATHAIDMIDQTTLGHTFIKDQFGVTPTIGWQIDPFGHSATQAALLSAEVGFDGLFFGRIDWADIDMRTANKNMEFIWRPSESLGPTAQVFASVFITPNTYGPPSGMCFDFFCSDDPVQDDPRLEDYNVQSRVQDFVNIAHNQASQTLGDDILWTLGSDFQYENANLWFKNLDKLIRAVNADGRVKAMYSTPSTYLKAKYASNLTLTVKTDDFFPYGFAQESMQVGYFSSRPALKRYVRMASPILQIARQLAVINGADDANNIVLWEALSVAQHHDGVTGSSKQHVAYDYARRLSNGIDIAEVSINDILSTLTTISGTPSVLFSCPLLNISICNITQNLKNITIILYNGIGITRNEVIIIPINTPYVTVYDYKGNIIISGINKNSYNNALHDDSAIYTLQFYVTMEPLSIATYFIIYSNNNNNNIIENNFPINHSSNYRSLQSKEVEKNNDKQVEKENVEQQVYTTITNDLLSINIYNNNGSLATITDIMTGETFLFSQIFSYYPAKYVNNEHDIHNDGAYLFAPAINSPINLPLNNNNILFNIIYNNISIEIHQNISQWITQIIRLPKQSFDIPSIEFIWTVGSVPVDDNVGKDVVVRYSAGVASNGTWYTDSNGREFQTRRRNFHPSWPFDGLTPIASNYYPCNAVCYMTDGKRAMAVVVDRSQGVTSMNDSVLEFMVHRRLLHDDGLGVNEPLNETDGITGADGTRIGKGLVVTGKHTLILSTAANINRLARSIQLREYQPIHLSFSPLTVSLPTYLSTHNTYQSFIKTSLPNNVELMTLQPWKNNTILIRLAHQYGINEDPVLSKPANVDLSQLFMKPLVTVTEVSLTANQNLSDMRSKRMRWSTHNDTYSHPVSLNDNNESDDGLNAFVYTLTALQIRSFIVSYQ